MVVHPSPGHYTGTLVNALLHHCHLPAMQLAIGSPPPLSLTGAAEEAEEEVPDDDVVEETELGPLVPLQCGRMPIIRPGIVHRLDKGTSGRVKLHGTATHIPVYPARCSLFALQAFL